MEPLERISNEIKRLKEEYLELEDYSAVEALDYIGSYVNIIIRETEEIYNNIKI